jgi:hypothetical protein
MRWSLKLNQARAPSRTFESEVRARRAEAMMSRSGLNSSETVHGQPCASASCLIVAASRPLFETGRSSSHSAVRGPSLSSARPTSRMARSVSSTVR